VNRTSATPGTRITDVSATRRVKTTAVIAALVVSGTLVPTVAFGLGSHHPAPTASQLAHSKHVVAQREHQVRVAARAVGVARAALARLNVTAEVAFENYDAAKVKLAAARRAARIADRVLAGANRQVAESATQAARFATVAYETGGLSSLNAYLEPGGASELVSRVGALNAISVSEHNTLEQLDAARIYRTVVSRQANAVRAKAAAAAAVAAKAKAAAAAQVSKQQAVLASLRHQQSRLARLLTTAKATASRLQREHLAALARARRRAAAQATTPPTSTAPSPYSGGSGSTAGTVSASTALSALHAAESQIGKPYQWGAAGPDSYDCSGLVMWAYGQFGVHLDHWTGDQWNEGAHVSQSQLRPGDLVFFAFNTSDPATIHHVGMYVGGGEMVDAPYTGVDVRYDSAFRSDYIGAVRPYNR
jgi:cell wall-associated NlpC family hydrolase